MKTTTKMRMYRVEFGVGEAPSHLIRSYFVWTNGVAAAIKEAREIKNRQESDHFERWYWVSEVEFRNGSWRVKR